MTEQPGSRWKEDREKRRQENEKRQKAQTNGAAQPEPAPLIEFSDVTPKPVAWTWWPRIPAGCITLIGGTGGSGKGHLGMDATARITAGNDWPDSEPNNTTGHVLWCEAEDPLEQVIIPRAIAAGVDRDNATFADRASFGGIESLRDFIIARRTRLIVLSPLMSFLAGLVNIRDEHNVREVLEQLQSTIAGLDCAILGLAHTNKKPDLIAIERILGAVAFSNFVRSVLLAAKEKQDDSEEQEQLFRFVHAKHNLSPKSADLTYRAVHVGSEPRSQYVRLEWSTPDANVDADAVFDRSNRHDNRPNRRPSAEEWLVDYLRKHGASLRADVISAGDNAGYSESALRKAQGRGNQIYYWQEDGRGPYWWALR